MNLNHQADVGFEQYKFGDTGVLLNSDAALPFVDIELVQGLSNAPGKVQTLEREGIDGGFVDINTENFRTITIEGQIYTDANATEAYLDLLKANFAATGIPKPLYVGTDSGQRAIVVKSAGLNYDKDRGRSIGKIPFQVQLYAEDPRLYTPGAISASTSLSPGSLTGRGYNKAYPFGYGGAAQQSGVTINVGGNRNTPATIRITGAVVNPIVEHTTSGTRFEFNLSLADGDYIDIDLREKTVVLNGTQSYRTKMKLIGSWPLLDPGLHSFTLQGTQSPPTPVAGLTVTAYSAWR